LSDAERGESPSRHSHSRKPQYSGATVSRPLFTPAQAAGPKLPMDRPQSCQTTMIHTQGFLRYARVMHGPPPESLISSPTVRPINEDFQCRPAKGCSIAARSSKARLGLTLQLWPLRPSTAGRSGPRRKEKGEKEKEEREKRERGERKRREKEEKEKREKGEREDRESVPTGTHESSASLPGETYGHFADWLRALKLAGNCFRGLFRHHGTSPQRIETSSRAFQD
jgi:hypothetical protein